MYIISSFKDYYDSSSLYGIDTEVKYIRKFLDIGLKGDIEKYQPLPTNWNGSCISGYIGYCGVLIPFVAPSVGGLLDTGYSNNDFKLFGREYHFIYTKEHYSSVLNKVKDAMYKRNSSVNYNNANYTYLKNNKVEIFNFLNTEHKITEFLGLFQEYNTPVFVVIFDQRRRVTCRINPYLKELQFFKVKNSVDVYQDIMSFISGVLVHTEDKSVTISDKYQVLKKGFDPTYGFRKRPKIKGNYSGII